MTKIDFKKDYKNLYNPSAKAVTLVDVPAMKFAMIDGTGNPNNSLLYQSSVEALYTLSYTLKFMLKKRNGVDYGVLPLEGLWWVADVSHFSYDQRDNWFWTMMIMQPDFVTALNFQQALAEAQDKKDNPRLADLRFESYDEGCAAQIMHIGPYSAEKPTIDRLHAGIQAQGYAIRGKHHEIYLGDPNRTAPEKLKTVIRYPVQKV